MQLKPGAHIHLMGICGTAMASLAGILKEQGFQVTGSDQNVYPPMSTQLKNLGIEIMEGYKKENLTPRPDLVIVGNVISRTHEEAQALLQSDIPYTSLPKALGEYVIQDRHSVVVAGTHGKTTTTSQMAWMCEQMGLQPGFLIGGIPKNFGFSFRSPRGGVFVIEGDEYDTAFFDKVPKFVHYRPCSVILTSVEFDHADIYADLQAVKAAFARLLQLIPAEGLLVARAEDSNITDLLSQYPVPRLVTYGWKVGDYTVGEVHKAPQQTRFEVLLHGKKIIELTTQLFGDFNILNVLATFVVARERGWDLQKAAAGIASFTGVKRRQEVLGQPRDITVIEDFAHHPTAVQLTIQTVQERFSGARVLSVFEPRSATSRRKIFQQDYARAFQKAQEVVIAEPYDQSKILQDDRFSASQLVQELQKQGVAAFSYASNAEIIEHLVQRAKPGDAILIMSNGGFGGLYDQLLRRLEHG